MDLVIIFVLKLINRLIPTKALKKKIKRFYLNKAHKTIFKLRKLKQKNSSLIKIKIILFFSGIILNVKQDEFYHNLIELIAGDTNNQKNRSYLISQIQSENFNSINYRTWLRLRDLFYLKLEIVLGGLCREKAIKNILKNKNTSFLEKKNKSRARLEKTLNIDKPQSHFERYPLEYNFDRHTINKLFFSIHNFKSDFKNIEGSKDKDNDILSNILRDKTVAIVGPSETDSKDASEIDSFDFVVRLNYIQPGKNLDQVYKGLRADIGYFNGEQIDFVIKNNDGKLPDDLKVACIKEDNSYRKNKIEKSNPEKIVKTIINYNSLTFFSSFNLLPLVILDILPTEPKIVKIFHSDLFLTVNRVANYYPSAFNRDKKFVKDKARESFLNHDPAMQHHFLKKIYKINKIKGDEKFDKVMKLETLDYLKKLENIYK